MTVLDTTKGRTKHACSRCDARKHGREALAPWHHCHIAQCNLLLHSSCCNALSECPISHDLLAGAAQHSCAMSYHAGAAAATAGARIPRLRGLGCGAEPLGAKGPCQCTMQGGHEGGAMTGHEGARPGRGNTQHGIVAPPIARTRCALHHVRCSFVSVCTMSGAHS